MLQAHRRARGVVQREGVKPVAHLDGVRGHALIEEVLDAAVEHFDDLGGQLAGGGGLQLVGLLTDGDGHKGLPKSDRVDYVVQ